MEIKKAEKFVDSTKIKDILEEGGWIMIPSGVLTSYHNMDSDCMLMFRKCDFKKFKEIQNFENHFDNYDSLLDIKSEKDSLVIGFDTEFELDESGKNREVISYQFALIWRGYLCEFVYIMKDRSKKLWLEYMLGRILNYLGIKATDCRKIKKYKAIVGENNGKSIEAIFETKEEAEEASICEYKKEKVKVKVYYDWSDIEKINVTLVAHCGIADLTCLEQNKKYRHNIINHLTDISGGAVSLRDFFLPAIDCNHGAHPYQYPIKLSIRDTMCFAPEKSKALKVLGDAINVPKIEVKSFLKKSMGFYLDTNPIEFIEYASNDALITLLYTSSLFGENKSAPVTLTSITATVVKKVIMDYLNCENAKDFDLKYRGLVKEYKRDEDVNDRKLNGHTFSAYYVPINYETKLVLDIAKDSYHGGYNSSSEIGYFPFITKDKDMRNAYPTGMSLVPDFDYMNPIKKNLINHELTLEDFRDDNGKINPLLPMIAYVEFEFPRVCNYPCLPMPVEDSLLYFLSSKGEDGVYVCGPELYLACKLGAKVKVRRGYVLNTLKIDGRVSYSLRVAVHQLVLDRMKAKENLGKDSLEEMILKIMVNAIYGKSAQNVKEKRAWNNYFGRMEDLNASAITNPISAALTTSIIRAVLLAAQNELANKGYKSYSVTTDGFIVDCPDDYLDNLDLYGFKPFLEEARLYLTNGTDKRIWETKHIQDDLLNLNTRLNTSMHDKKHNYFIDDEGNVWEGVNAHGGIHSPYPSDTIDDRYWLRKELVSRTGKIESKNQTMTSCKDICEGKEFGFKDKIEEISADYDMKRKPVEESLRAEFIIIDEERYEVATFTTVPFETKEEYLFYRQARKEKKCLRTVEQMKNFFLRTKFKTAKSNGIRVKSDCEPKKIMTDCIRGYFQKKWDIPAFDGLKGKKLLDKVNECCEGFTITSTDIANARRKDRKCTIPDEILMEKVRELAEKTA